MPVMEEKPPTATAWANRLKDLQGDRSNQEMADLLGVSIHTYLAWKYKKRKPSKMAVRVVGIITKIERKF